MIKDVPDGPGDRRPHGPRTAAALVAALAVAAIGVAGCGGGGSATGTAATTTAAGAPPHTTTTPTTATGGGGSGSGSAQPRVTVERAVAAVLMPTDGSQACSSQYVTDHYLSAAYGGREGCVQAQRPGNAASSLGGLGVKLDGDHATATVHPSGGLYDGEKITISLVKVSDGWRVDGIKSNAPVGP